jgi:DNA invertase Pin-like site-specific DNA recombinase
MKLLGYIRVSTESQKDNYSLEDQENKIIAYCSLYGHSVEIFKDVASGSLSNRKGLTELLSKLESYDGLIVFKLDRLARKTTLNLQIAESITDSKKALISVTEQMDFSTPQGKLFLTMFSGFGEYEREVIKERMTNGRKAKKNKGLYSGGQPKLGYKVEHRTIQKEDGKTIIEKSLIKDDKEQQLIDLVRRHHKSGKSALSIAKWLNSNGYKTKQNKEFTHVQIKRILNNEKTKQTA